VVELRRGDLFFFMDHLINHSNEKAYGQRHSVVAFTEHMVWKATERKYGFKDLRAAGKHGEIGERPPLRKARGPCERPLRQIADYNNKNWFPIAPLWAHCGDSLSV
jgi:hypothetical protein